MRRMFSALIMAATLGAPMAVPASALAGTSGAAVTVRIYDPYRRDYHRWDDREERAYRSYLAERHRSYRAYEHQRIAQRRAYWRWRHEREERLDHERR